MPAPAIPPHVFVIFGATGDLTERKLLPALYHLMQRRTSEGCYILGAARSDWDDARFRNFAREALEKDGVSQDDLATWCDQHIYYQCLGDSGGDISALRQKIDAIEAEHDLPGNRVFYLALPPRVFPATVEALDEHGLSSSDGFTRIVIEKPFGHDLASAKKLNDHVHQFFREDQIYRIDHFLGKETVQNLLVFRFANALFEPLWNRDRIERVEITVAESLGIGDRAGYFDRAGTLRDMIQNHLTQLFTLVAVDPPSAFTAEAIRREKVKVLQSVRPIDLGKDVVFGQYTAGTVQGEPVPGYLDAEGVADDSNTETFVALRLWVDNWRWQGVPFYLRTGKRMPEKRTQIAIRFRCAPVALFDEMDSDDTPVQPNVLLVTLQPNEGFDLRFEVKVPSDAFRLDQQQFQFRYEDAFDKDLPDAYETLLHDVIRGDQTLFIQDEEVETAWALYAVLLENDVPVHDYEAGTWGPDAVGEKLLVSWVTGGE